MRWIDTPRSLTIVTTIAVALTSALAAWTGYGIAQNAPNTPSVVVVIVQH